MASSHLLFDFDGPYICSVVNYVLAQTLVLGCKAICGPNQYLVSIEEACIYLHFELANILAMLNAVTLTPSGPVGSPFIER